MHWFSFITTVREVLRTSPLPRVTTTRAVAFWPKQVAPCEIVTKPLFARACWAPALVQADLRQSRIAVSGFAANQADASRINAGDREPNPWPPGAAAAHQQEKRRRTSHQQSAAPRPRQVPPMDSHLQRCLPGSTSSRRGSAWRGAAVCGERLQTTPHQTPTLVRSAPMRVAIVTIRCTHVGRRYISVWSAGSR